MNGRHITPAGAAVIADALQRASADMADAVVPIPTSVQAFFAVHGADLQALLTSLSYITTAGDTPSAYDVLQIAHRTGAAGEVDDAARLRRLADHMITQAAPPSPVRMGVDPANTPDVTAAMIAVGLNDGTQIFATIEEVVRACVPARAEDQLRIAEAMTRYLAEMPQRTLMAGKLEVGHG